jgi:hypothetical protein
VRQGVINDERSSSIKNISQQIRVVESKLNKNRNKPKFLYDYLNKIGRVHQIYQSSLNSFSSKEIRMTLDSLVKMLKNASPKDKQTLQDLIDVIMKFLKREEIDYNLINNLKMQLQLIHNNMPQITDANLYYLTLLDYISNIQNLRKYNDIFAEHIRLIRKIQKVKKFINPIEYIDKFNQNSKSIFNLIEANYNLASALLYLRAMQTNSISYDAYYKAASSYFKLNKPEISLVLYQTLQKYALNYTQVHFNKGIVYITLMERTPKTDVETRIVFLNNAVKELETSRKFNPNFLTTRSSLCYVYFLTDRIKDALNEFAFCKNYFEECWDKFVKNEIINEILKNKEISASSFDEELLIKSLNGINQIAKDITDEFKVFKRYEMILNNKKDKIDEELFNDYFQFIIQRNNKLNPIANFVFKNKDEIKNSQTYLNNLQKIMFYNQQFFISMQNL